MFYNSFNRNLYFFVQMRNVLIDVLTLKEYVITSIVCRAVRYIITVIIVVNVPYLFITPPLL